MAVRELLFVLLFGALIWIIGRLYRRLMAASALFSFVGIVVILTLFVAVLIKSLIPDLDHSSMLILSGVGSLLGAGWLIGKILTP